MKIASDKCFIFILLLFLIIFFIWMIFNLQFLLFHFDYFPDPFGYLILFINRVITHLIFTRRTRKIVFSRWNI